MPKTGFEPRTSGIGNDRSTNWATTTEEFTDYWSCPHDGPNAVEDIHGYADTGGGKGGSRRGSQKASLNEFRNERLHVKSDFM